MNTSNGFEKVYRDLLDQLGKKSNVFPCVLYNPSDSLNEIR